MYFIYGLKNTSYTDLLYFHDSGNLSQIIVALGFLSIHVALCNKCIIFSV